MTFRSLVGCLTVGLVLVQAGPVLAQVLSGTEGVGGGASAQLAPAGAGNGSTGLQFDGVDDYVTFGIAPALGTPTFTLETWFQWTGGGSSVVTGSGGIDAIPLLAKGRGESDGNNRDMNYLLGIQPGSQVLVADLEEAGNGGQPGLNHPIAGTTPISIGQWHHAAVTYDGSEWRLYLDGNLESTLVVGFEPRADTIQHASLATALDSGGVPAGQFAGILDEARIWNYARSASQIATNRFLQLSTAPGLIGRWSLDEGSGTTAQDSSGNGLTGTLMGGPAWVPGYPFAVAPSVSLTRPAQYAVFTAPANITLEANATDLDGTVEQVEFFAGTDSLGSDNTAPFALNWNQAGVGQYGLTAVATDNAGLSSTSAPVQITVEHPVVQMSSPTNDARFIIPLDIPLAAAASDANGTIVRVEFYEGTTRIAEVFNRPFEGLWRSPNVGEYYLTAVAIDNGGTQSTSAPVHVTVISNLPPEVTLTAPADGAAFFVPTDVTLTATASDPDGVVTNVQFFEGATLLGADANAPYQFIWQGAPVGDYDLTAVAYDDWGRPATSSVARVQVLTSEPPSVAAFLPPPGLVSNLTAITVQFTEPVTGVDAADLLINGAPARNVGGANARYTFTFPAPAEGLVTVTWAGNHGIQDQETPPLPFNGAAANETATYDQVDTVAPVVQTLTPPAGTILRSLREVTVVFSEPVRGVEAADLLVNGAASTAVAGSGMGPYVFQFAAPPTGLVQIQWAAGHGITDFSRITNAFAGGSWDYTVDPTASFDGVVVISEIMYHPASENLGEEFIEIHNTTPEPVNLTGWRFSRGVDFTFPDLSLPGNGYLVVAADPAVFAAKYPGVTGVLGGWTGRLNNDDEAIELVDAVGERVDRVEYADEGDWAVRQRGPNDGGYYGWEWYAEHDGSARNTATGQTVSDRSLELINPALPNNNGQNWAASAAAGGSPGQPNSAASADAAPLILDVQHFPLVPRPADAVTITARIVDEQVNDLFISLHYRDHSSRSPAAFTTVQMLDDGQHNDGSAADGLYGYVVPPQANGTVIEFYVEANDEALNVRTWPAPARQLDGSFAQTANALYQVDENLAGLYTGGQPIYRLIMTESERYELQNINRSSDAEMNATFISFDGTSQQLRYLVGVRIRGSGSRSRTPTNYRVNFPTDGRWNGLEAINLNTQFVHSQLVGSAFALKSGLPCAAARVVQLRVNGANLARSEEPVTGSSTGSGFGSYVMLEPLNGDWAARHFPTDGDGNVYRADSDLSYHGENPSSYYGRYNKNSNNSENDWTDLIRLTDALSGGDPDPVYLAQMRTNANVQMWMRYFAVCSMLVYSENGLPTGVGDDYALYRGVLDPRFLLIPHDFDTVLGEGDNWAYAYGTGMSIWQMVDRGRVPVLTRFMRQNEFAPLYFRELKRLAETTFAPTNSAALLDELLGGWVPEHVIDRMKNFVAQRVVNALAQIPQSFTVSSGLVTSNGLPYTTSSTLALSGTANALKTDAVEVNGVAANWVPWQGRWDVALPLYPGYNTVQVRCLGTNGIVVDQTNLTVWHQGESRTTLPRSIEENVTLTAAGGPYLATTPVLIERGFTVTLEAGATVYLADGANFDVYGQLIAEGTADRHIRITRRPESSAAWRSIQFFGGAEQRLAYVEIEHGGVSGAPNLVGNGANLILDHVSWAHTSSRLLELNNSSLQLLHSVLPSIVDTELVQLNGVPNPGVVLIQGNEFGRTSNGADVVRITGGNIPGTVPQILDNVFAGAGDEALELLGSDALIEGNLFLHVHQDSAANQAAHAIAAYADGSTTSELTVVRNFFYDCDHALLLREGASANFQNNTVVGAQTNALAAEPASAISLGEPQLGLPGAAGVKVDGNIFWDLDGGRLLSNYTNGMTVTVNRSIVPGTNWPGIGNLSLDPRFVNLDTNAITAATIRQDLSLRPGSPAIGAGPSGLDMGALVPGGIVISGEPISPTPMTNVTLQVTGVGIDRYIYLVSDGRFGSLTEITNPIVLTGLTNGTYSVTVMGHNVAGIWQSFDNATISRTWTVNTAASPLRLNEVLARNDTAVPVAGAYPDLIELYNSGPGAVDLSGMSVSDNPSVPRKFVFPAGASLAAENYLILYADNATVPAGHHLGFNLNQVGDAVYLFNAGGQLLDTVAFGPQAADYSIGRGRDGKWELTQPTFGSANQSAPTGDLHNVVINEWLAAPGAGGGADFIELFNPNVAPVNLSGAFLTDLPHTWPDQHQVAPLSYVPGGGFTVFLADGNTERGPEHVNFTLQSEQGLIGLFAPDRALVDVVYYGPQTNGVSTGRSPNGALAIVAFDTPTPGAPNPAPGGPGGGQIVLNEVMAKNLGVTDIGLPNPEGKTPEWLELYNPTAEPVDLTDLSLSDDVANPRQYVFAAGETIPAGGYRVMLCEGDQPASASNTGFGIKANGDTLYLFDALTRGGALLDAIAYGVQAKDLSIGRIPNGDANWNLTLPTAGAPNIAAQLGNVAVIKINEWMADPNTGEDWFELYNPSAQPVAIGGLYLTDDIGTAAGRIKYQIAPLSFLGTGLYGFERFEADNNPVAGPNHVNFKLSRSGEAIGVYQSADRPIDTVTFGPQVPGVSEGRLPDGQSRIVRFAGTATPNDANYLPLTDVVINELLSHSDPPLEDAIELHNTTAFPADIGGWYLSDSQRDLFKYRIPDGTLIAPGGFRVFYETNFSLDLNLSSPFALNSAKGETVYLTQTASNGDLTGYRGVAEFGPAKSAISFGRYTNSAGAVAYVAMSGLTFGVDDPESVEAFRTGRGQANTEPLIGPVVITEIMYHPPDENGLDNVTDEFIELRNRSAQEIALYDPAHPTNTWRLRGGVRFDFPRNTTIPSGDYLVVVGFDPLTNATALAAFRATYQLSTNVPLVGPYIGKLDNGGESIRLLEPDQPEPPGDPDAGYVPYVVVEQIDYDDMAPWPVSPNPDGGGASLQRIDETLYGNDPANWIAASPSPGPQGLLIDFDKDGMPDLWEADNGLDVERNDALEDLDGDGLLNIDEFYAGTAANDGQSALRLVLEVNGTVTLSFVAHPDRAYVLEFKDDLTAASWTLLADISPQAATRTERVIDPAPAGSRFYRLRMTQWP